MSLSRIDRPDDSRTRSQPVQSLLLGVRKPIVWRDDFGNDVWSPWPVTVDRPDVINPSLSDKGNVRSTDRVRVLLNQKASVRSVYGSDLFFTDVCSKDA